MDREYSFLYNPLGNLANTTRLNQPLADRFMQISHLHASILIADTEGRKLHDLDKSLEEIFGTPPGAEISTLTEQETISETQEWSLARNRMSPDHYSIYLLNDGASLSALNRLTKSALYQVLRREKFAFLPRYATIDMGGFAVKTPARPPSVEPLSYLAGRLFLMRYSNHLILPKS